MTKENLNRPITSWSEDEFGMVMHTTFAVTTQGLPIGLLDQKISARTELEPSNQALEKKEISQIFLIPR